MICDNVHNHLYALSVAVCHEAAVVLIAAETPVDMIVVGACIAVVGGCRLVVLEERSVPDGGHAEVSNIVQLAADACDVTSVAAEEGLLVHALHIAGHCVKALVPIHEAVRHDEIDEVLRREAETFCGTLAPCGNLVWILE